MTSDQLCPCGSGLEYPSCCELLHKGQPAATPEALMRSRFSAFVLGLEDYLAFSWHQETRPAGPYCDKGTRWTRLSIEDCSESGDVGEVTFVATFQSEGRWQQLTETSRFFKVAEHWKYYDGLADWCVLQPGRNDPCPCGSGSKYKKCCA